MPGRDTEQESVVFVLEDVPFGGMGKGNSLTFPVSCLLPVLGVLLTGLAAPSGALLTGMAAGTGA